MTICKLHTTHVRVAATDHSSAFGSWSSRAKAVLIDASAWQAIECQND